ncbi:hypothetical protein [Micromonospora craniellae]|uniref:hypothetical protein n=1 Tax=Micromonospora craniellae TaxID=2294034 RepID=UPI001CC6B2FD|nr:hypothetical protein [Micromonospora craniellae]
MTPHSTAAQLAAISHAFNNHVLGTDRPQLIESCLRLVTPPTTNQPARVQGTAHPAAAELADFAVGLTVDLSRLPSPLIRRILDAFAIDLHRPSKGASTRLTITVSAILRAHELPRSALCLEVPDDWPALTPPAAQALLRLLVHTAQRRDTTPTQHGA